MTTPSSIPAAIDALIAVFTTAIGADYVNDGPGATQTDGNAYVYVGCQDGDDKDAPSASSDQEWAWLGHTQRDETIEVYCDARAWTGDQDDQKTPRDAVFGLLAKVTDTISTDPSLGGAVIYVSGIKSSTLRQFQNASGANAALAFTVTCRARLS